MPTHTLTARSLTLTTPPATDIWRKPPTHNVFTSPHTLTTAVPLHIFRRARATLSFTPVLQYDQGGLLLALSRPSTPPGASAPTASDLAWAATAPSGGSGAVTADSAQKWIKAGVEFYEGAPRLSVVACDGWADWSVAPLPDAVASASAPVAATVELRREVGSSGVSLWVVALEKGAGAGEVRRRPLREICWVYGIGEEWEVRVGVYGARPAGKEDAGREDTGEELVVRFEDAEVEVEV
ncbi:hypothetical protein BDY21DRAFT_328562 [Lineolata rhizophorae]|uniref:Uncharacterized protein n=1 Tax=Lineolata rhizophorae TaxID=578093 RepID=A0A6A6NNE0_9PEZI|nr:hypothetical protein BDY21DRAFT_328562 [Lineolata rhizophorae]